MSIVRTADFYYGVALSALFNNSNKKISAALIMSDESRQLYNLTTNDSECRLFIKYRSGKTNTKTEDYYSWSFTLTDRDKSEIQTLLDKGNNLILALVCGVEGLTDSELALLDRNETPCKLRPVVLKNYFNKVVQGGLN